MSEGWLDRLINNGKAEGRAESLRSLMETTDWTIEQAMMALKIPASEQQKYAKLIEQL